MTSKGIMAIRTIKPTTSGQRFQIVDDFSDITKKKPEKSLTIRLKKHAGRDRFGHISIRHHGGGSKRHYRLIDFKQTDMMDIPAKVLAIEYDPNRTGRIALIQYENGKKSYIVAPSGLKVGEDLIFSEKTDVKTGNRMKMKYIPTGIAIHNIELNIGRGGQLARGAGQSATILAHEGKYSHVRLPSGEVRLIHEECFASIGSVSHQEHSAERIGKAGRVRWRGLRPTVRGKAMNPDDHPHGGGEGVNPIGLKHPKTPWGKPALGYKTRKNKRTGKFILKRRKK